MNTSTRLARSALCLLAAPLLALVPPARADVEITTFGPGGSYSQNSDVVVGSNANIFPFSTALANIFTASFTGTLTSVDLGVIALGGGIATVELYPNNPLTYLPLTEAGITLGTVTATPAGGVQTLTASGTPIPLVNGVTYWLGLLPANNDTKVGWYYGIENGDSTSAYSADGGATYSFVGGDEAYDINATPLGLPTPIPSPEPSTWAIVLGGAGLLGWTRHRRAGQV